jgi:hypothetical protein
MTAIEFLELNLLGIISFDSEELRAKYKERIKKAKEIEKKIIINSWNDGAYGGGQFTETHDNSEQYYNETFKQL